MKKQQINMDLMICVGSTILISVLVALMIYFTNSSSLVGSYVGNLTDEWLCEDGSKAPLTDVDLSGGHVSLYRRITKHDPMNMDLCFVSKNVFFKLYCEDRLVYDFHPDIQRFYGKAYGSYVHCVTLPGYGAGSVLRIDIDTIYHNSGFLNEMSLINAGTFMQYRINIGMPGFVLCIITFIYGVILLILSIFGTFFRERRNELAAIAAFAIIASVWTATGTGMLQIITARPEVVHFIEYISLMLLPCPAVIYDAYVTGNKNFGIRLAVTILTFGNLTLTVCLNLLGIRDYHELLLGTHLVIASSILMIGYMTIQGFRHKTIDRKMYRFLIIAFIMTTLTGAVDLLKYTLSGNRADTGNTFRLGIFAFVILVGGYELTVLLDMSRKGQYAELMEQIAYHDGLTGLFNRQAFLREEKSLQEKGSGEYIIVQFDVNNLKTMNDTYGHAMGDKLIADAATVIRESFGAEHCFRTGGDEFIAIIPENRDRTAFTAAESRMAEMLKEYNRTCQSPIDLSIAYGYARYDASARNPESAEQQADANMYEMKKRMKESLPSQTRP